MYAQEDIEGLETGAVSLDLIQFLLVVEGGLGKLGDVLVGVCWPHTTSLIANTCDFLSLQPPDDHVCFHEGVRISGACTVWILLYYFRRL